MSGSLEGAKTKTIKFPIPRRCICPGCRIKQTFIKHKERWRTLKDMNLEGPLLLRVRIVYARCKNKDCKVYSFPLPTPGIERYARSSTRLRREAVAGVVEDNSTLPRISKRLSRSFNTTGSKSAIDRWKHKEADKYDIKDIISKLGFSGVLCVDEYMPTKADNYHLIAGDAIKVRLLYIEPVPEFYGRGFILSFLKKLKSFGIKPYAIVFDLLTAFPKQVKKVWPNIIIQFDYFHVQQWIHKYLKNALIQFRQSLKGEEWELHREELWEHKWSLLMDMDKWKDKEHLLIPEMMDIYSGTIVEKILIFKEQLWNIFDNSNSRVEAYAKRNSLYKETFWQNSWHLTKAMNFLISNKFKYMVTYLDRPDIPRSGNSETLNSIWRQMESARFGFKTYKGRLNHLKLYQISKYLEGNFS
jgi:hypothetical protein